MEVRIDTDAFNELQSHLVAEIAASVYHGLEELKLSRARLEDILHAITFNVCCAIDGSTIMEHAGERLLPVLTFAKSPEFEQVISNGRTSFMHEYVLGLVEQLLEERA